MQNTTNYNLKKPEYTDTADIGDINDNMDTIDAAMATFKTKQTAKSNPDLSDSAALSFIDTISQNANGEITATRRVIGAAQVNNIGGLKIGFSENNKKYAVKLDATNKGYVEVPWTDHYAWSDITGKPSTFTPPLAASGTRGGIQLGYTQSGKSYPVQVSSEKAFVNVPWTDTTYNPATTSANGLMSSSDKTKLNGISTGANATAKTVLNGSTSSVSVSSHDTATVSVSLSVPSGYSISAVTKILTVPALPIAGFEIKSSSVEVTVYNRYSNDANVTVAVNALALKIA